MSARRNPGGNAVVFQLLPKRGHGLRGNFKVSDELELDAALQKYQQQTKAKHKRFDADRMLNLEIWDGDDAAVALADRMIEARLLRPSTLEQWYDELDGAREDELAAMFYAVEFLGTSGDLSDVRRRAEDLRPFEGDTRAFAEDFVDSAGGIGAAVGDRVNYYFDYEKFGSDARSDEESHAQAQIEELESSLDEEEQEDDPDLEAARENLQRIEQMSDRELGEDVIDSIGSIDDALGANAESYFDWDAYTRDLAHDVTEFEFGGSTWTILSE